MNNDIVNNAHQGAPSDDQSATNCMVCVGGAPQPSQHDPDVIRVDEHYPTEEEFAPFDPKDIVRIRSNAKFEEFYDIDEANSGKVYHCVERSSKLELAAKFIKIRKDADREQVEHEVSVMTRMRHPRIAQIYDAFYSTSNDVILVMELVKGGELFNRVVEDNFVLTETAAAVIICQLCEAIDYIHKQNIVHLDIKPENIMCVTESGNRIKLIDFGLARHYDGSEDLYYMAGTPEFSAPEVIKFEPLDFRTDMWSIIGIFPFLGETTPLTYCNVERGEWEFIEEFDCVSEVAKDFISNYLYTIRVAVCSLGIVWCIHGYLVSEKEPKRPTSRSTKQSHLAVMSYCEFTSILNVLRKKNSTKGLEYFSKAKIDPAKKKKKSLASAVLAAKNIDANQEPAVVVTACEPSTSEVQEETPDALKVEKKMQKTESSDSTKENNITIPKIIEPIPKASEGLPPHPEGGVVKKKKIVRKKKPVRETPARTSELDLLRAQADGNSPSKKLIADVRQSTTDTGTSGDESDRKPKCRSYKLSTDEATTSAKTDDDRQEENGETVKKVTMKTEDSKSPSTSRGSFEPPKLRVNSLIAERMQKLRNDAPPLTFNISGKKLETPKTSSTSTEKTAEPPKLGFKELKVVTEKKSTTTTTTQVRSKIENSERKLTTQTADKKIEEVIGKKSSQQQVSLVTTAEEQCPETGLQKKTFQKSVAKNEKHDKEEEKNRREEHNGDEKLTVKTQRSLKREENDRSILQRLTKVDGETKDNKKLEVTIGRLKKVDGKATHEIDGGKASLQNVELNITSHVRRSIKGNDGSREEKTDNVSKFESKIKAGRTDPAPEKTSLAQELARLKKTKAEEPLKSALKREDSEKKSVRLGDIMLPRIRFDEERGSTRVKFADPTPPIMFPTTSTFGGGLQKNKSETNIAARVKNTASTTTKQKTLDDSGIKKRQHWLYAEAEGDVKPREDFTFGALKAMNDRRSLIEPGKAMATKDLLERRVSGDFTSDKPKAMIKIPNANFAMSNITKAKLSELAKMNMFLDSTAYLHHGEHHEDDDHGVSSGQICTSRWRKATSRAQDALQVGASY
ncbi:unnamed protein product, partial [Mesorhabditis spiculigera]